jgi:hypothetical protein
MPTTATDKNPVTRYPSDDFPRQEQDQPGLTKLTEPTPDHGEKSYVGTGKLTGMRALITGGDSGIGRAVAIAFAREGADVAISYLPEEEEDAADTSRWIEQAGRTALRLPGNVRSEAECSSLVDEVVERLGGVDILVLNAAYQQNRDGLENIPTEELQRVFDTNLYAPLWIARAAIPHLSPGSSIITTSSIQAFNPSPQLIDYAMTTAARWRSRRPSRSSWVPAESGSTPSHRGRSGLRSSRRRRGPTRCRRSGRTPRSAVRVSRPNSRPPMSSSRRPNRRMCRARCCP